METILEKLEFSKYENVSSNERSAFVTLEGTAKSISQSMRLKEKTLNAREALRNGKKDEYDRIKKFMPAVTPHARFEGSRKKDSEYTLTGLIMLDFDDLETERAKQLIEKAKTVPWVCLAYKSLSNKGLHLLIRYSPVEKSSFTDCYLGIMNIAKYYFCEEPDKACKDVTRLMIVNYDSEVYYNPEAEEFDFSAILSLQKIKEMTSLNHYLDIADSNLNWIAGNRHTTLVALASTLNRAGFDETEVIRECCTRYVQPGFEAEEIEQTISDVYQRYGAEHGANKGLFSSKKDKGTKRQRVSNIEKERESEDFFDEESMYTAACPSVEPLRKYVPDVFLKYVIDPNTSKEQQFTCATAFLVIAGTMMRRVSCHVKKNKQVFPYLYLTSVGVAASGKSCIDYARNIFKYHSDSIEQELKNIADKAKRDLKEWEKCQKKCQEEDCGCGEKPIVPSDTHILLSPNISENKLIEQLGINDEIPALIYASELDSTMKSKEMPLSSTLRAIYEGEPVSAHSLSRGDYGCDNPRASMLVSGTPAQQLRFFENKEDGLTSRFLAIHISDTRYIPLTAYSDCEEELSHKDLIEGENTLRQWSLAFSEYCKKREIFLKLSLRVRTLLDDYFMQREKINAKYSSDPLTSFTRRLRDMDIRLAMILTVCDLYKENQPDGEYEIPEEIIQLVISWNDFFIEQHLRLLSILPVEAETNNGMETAYAHVFEKLPCDFKLGDVLNIFEEVAKCSKKTVTRKLQYWVKKGLLIKESRRYRKVDCTESMQPTL